MRHKAGLAGQLSCKTKNQRFIAEPFQHYNNNSIIYVEGRGERKGGGGREEDEWEPAFRRYQKGSKGMMRWDCKRHGGSLRNMAASSSEHAAPAGGRFRRIQPQPPAAGRPCCRTPWSMRQSRCGGGQAVGGAVCAYIPAAHGANA